MICARPHLSTSTEYLAFRPPEKSPFSAEFHSILFANHSPTCITLAVVCCSKQQKHIQHLPECCFSVPISLQLEALGNMIHLADHSYDSISRCLLEHGKGQQFSRLSDLFPYYYPIHPFSSTHSTSRALERVRKLNFKLPK